MAAALACYFALFVKHKLSGGERGMVLVLAATVEQAKVVFDYVVAFLNNSPVLQKEIVQRHEARSGSRTASTLPSMPTHSARCVAAPCALASSMRRAYWRDDTLRRPTPRSTALCCPR